MEIKAIELFCQDGEQPATSTIIRLQRRIIGSIISEIGSAGYVLPTLEDGTPIVLCITAAAVGAPHGAGSGLVCCPRRPPPRSAI